MASVCVCVCCCFDLHSFVPSIYSHTQTQKKHTFGTAARADEAARKRAEKAALLAAEEAEPGSTSKVKKTPTLSKAKGKKKKNDLSLLEDALVGEAEKKTKAKKQKEREKKEKEAAALKAKAEKDAADQDNTDPLLKNTQAMIGGAVGRDANKATMQDGAGVSGIDGALHHLNVATTDVKKQKALYLAFEEKMLPTVKSDYPGLRLTQYKEKVFQLWKKSSENPQNHEK